MINRDKSTENRDNKKQIVFFCIKGEYLSSISSLSGTVLNAFSKKIAVHIDIYPNVRIFAN